MEERPQRLFTPTTPTAARNEMKDRPPTASHLFIHPKNQSDHSPDAFPSHLNKKQTGRTGPRLIQPLSARCACPRVESAMPPPPAAPLLLLPPLLLLSTVALLLAAVVSSSSSSSTPAFLLVGCVAGTRSTD